MESGNVATDVMARSTIGGLPIDDVVYVYCLFVNNKIYIYGKINSSYYDAMNPVFFQFWRANPKAPQPAKVCATGEAVGARWLQPECSFS